jgi:hypothetical protein
MMNVLLGTAVLLAAGALSIATDHPDHPAHAQECAVVACR